MRVSRGLQILGIVADIVTVLSIWGFGNKTPIWARILITILLIAVACLFIIAINKTSDVCTIVDYAFEDNVLTHIFIKRNDNYQEGILISIYMIDGALKKLIAIGWVTCVTDEKNIQVKVIRVIDDVALNNIWKNKSNIKNYFTKSKVRYTDMYGLGIEGV